jgi:hypothetical protein
MPVSSGPSASAKDGLGHALADARIEEAQYRATNATVL